MVKKEPSGNVPVKEETAGRKSVTSVSVKSEGRASQQHNRQRPTSSHSAHQHQLSRRKKSRQNVGRGPAIVRVGPITKNPFFNYLRDYRKNITGMSPAQIVKKAAERWRQMRENEKYVYMEQAKMARRRRGKKSRRRRRR